MSSVVVQSNFTCTSAQPNATIEQGVRAIGALDRIAACPEKHLVLHLLDALSQEEERSVLAAAAALEPGNVAEEPGRWHVRVPSKETDLSQGTFPGCDPPMWFPAKQFATPFMVQVQSGRPTRRRLAWALSTDAYLNPLEKKVNRFQGSGNVPFVIAMDVNELYGAFKWYEAELLRWFPLWSHVSGVILFEYRSNFVSRLFWRWQFFPNPHASTPVPEGVQAILGCEPAEREFPLYEGT